MGSNARIGVDVKDMKKGLQEAKNAVGLVKSEFDKLISSADLLNSKEEQLRTKMNGATKAMDDYRKATASLRKTTDECEKDVEELRKEKERLTAELLDAKNATNQDEKSIADLTKQLEDCEKKLAPLERQLAKNKTELNKTDTEINKVQKSYDKFKEELEDVGKEMEDTGEQTEDLEDDTKELGDVMDDLGIHTMSAQDAFGKLTEAAKDIRDNVNEITDAFEDLVKDGIKKTAEELKNLIELTEEYGIKSESSLAKTQTLLDGDMYDGADEIIREQTKKFGFDYSNIAEGWYLALSSAVPETDISDFTDTANKLAIGGFTDTRTSVDALTSIINAYKFDHSDADRIASILIATQDKGKAEVGELADTLSKVMSTGSLKELPFEDLMVASSYLTQGGIKAPDAMTALNRMILELGDITSNASKVLVKRTGMTFDELIKDGANLRDVIQILGDAGETAAYVLGEEFIITKSKLDESLFKNAKNIDDVMRIAKENGADLSVSLSDIFSEMRSQKGAAALYTQTSTSDYTGRLNEFKNLDDSLLNEQFDHLMDTTEKQKDIFKQTWQNVLVEMWMGGDSSKGLQTYVAGALQDLNDLSNEFIDDFDFSLIDKIGSTIETVVWQICNVIRDNKELIMELIDSLGNFIIQLVRYLPGFVEEILPELFELIEGFLEKSPVFFHLIPLITDILAFIIDNLPTIMTILYVIQGIFGFLSAVFEAGSLLLAIEILAEYLGTTLPAALGAAGGAISSIAGPIGIVVGVIAALITFFVTAYNKSAKFREELGKLIDRITNALSEAISSIVDAFNDLLEVVGLNDEKIELLYEALGILASGIAGIIGDSLILIINIFEGIVEHVMYTIELFDLFGQIVRGTFSAIVTGDWSGVISNIKKAMETALKDIFLPVKVLVETAEEIENNTLKGTTTNKVTTNTTPHVDIDMEKLMADVKNYNNSINEYQTPIINNNNKNVTSNNYFYSPSNLDERMIDKNMKNMLNEALFTSVS